MIEVMKKRLPATGNRQYIGGREGGKGRRGENVVTSYRLHVAGLTL
jgi:hypothetical protein